MLHDLFQSTHPSGVRPYSDDAEDLLKVISIHAPQWGATSAKPTTTDESEFQSTHPSGVRRPGLRIGTDGDCISIHAPQWGATAAAVLAWFGLDISIHAPQWGATGTPNRWPGSSPNFNPRTPVGCDLLKGHENDRPLEFQSTHPSGVRLSQPTQEGSQGYFNPRTPVGCDRAANSLSSFVTYFNPRTPVGCDVWSCGGATGRTDFNPRTPVGCDTRPRTSPS